MSVDTEGKCQGEKLSIGEIPSSKPESFVSLYHGGSLAVAEELKPSN